MNLKRITCFITYTIQEREIEHTIIINSAWLLHCLNEDVTCILHII